MTYNLRKLRCALALPLLSLNLAPAVGAAAPHGFKAHPTSVNHTTDKVTGKFSSSHMVVDVVLVPNNEAGLQSLLEDVYNPESANYQHWLGQDEFYTRFAPTKQQSAAVAAYLRESGLDVEASPSPFVVRVSGPSNVVRDPHSRQLCRPTAIRTGSSISPTALRFSYRKSWPPECMALSGFRTQCAFDRRRSGRPSRQRQPVQVARPPTSRRPSS